jgi:hypothetical protein
VGISEKKFTLDRILYSSGMTDGIICWSLLWTPRIMVFQNNVLIPPTCTQYDYEE